MTKRTAQTRLLRLVVKTTMTSQLLMLTHSKAKSIRSFSLMERERFGMKQTLRQSKITINGIVQCSMCSARLEDGFGDSD